MAAKISFETVRKLGLQLPDVDEGMGYGKPSLKVGGKMFACLPSHKSAEPDSLVVRTDFEQRAELLSGDPNRHKDPLHLRRKCSDIGQKFDWWCVAGDVGGMSSRPNSSCALAAPRSGSTSWQTAGRDQSAICLGASGQQRHAVFPERAVP